MSACPGNVCGLDKTEIVLTGPSTSVQGYYEWSIIYDARAGQNLQYYNVCMTVHTVWSSKGLILEGGGPIYGIVRMCVPNSPLFQHCQVYDWPPFFSKKYMNGPIFLVSYVKGPIFLTSWYMHMFFAQRFFEAAYPLGITWIDCDICVTTSKKVGTKKSKNRSTF